MRRVMPKSSSKKQKAIEELSYEEALAELEETVSALEGEQSQLEEAIKLFERGQALAARCSELLEAAELKVKQVVGDAVVDFEEASE
jgi:exodeoxyribonuclease VII small subunit